MQSTLQSTKTVDGKDSESIIYNRCSRLRLPNVWMCSIAEPTLNKIFEGNKEWLYSNKGCAANPGDYILFFVDNTYACAMAVVSGIVRRVDWDNFKQTSGISIDAMLEEMLEANAYANGDGMFSAIKLEYFFFLPLKKLTVNFCGIKNVACLAKVPEHRTRKVMQVLKMQGMV